MGFHRMILLILLGLGAVSPSYGSEALYKKHCSVCHGPEGKGDGTAAYLLFPKPRDLTRGLFKIRSTPSGSLPTDLDMMNVITRGIPGSAMPGFSYLTEEERMSLVQYIKTFSPSFAQREPLPPIVPVEEPSITQESLEEGKFYYRELECFKCHGEKGKGDGPSAEGLADDWGYPIQPNDFTRGIYKGGGENRDLYMRFVTGMAGTPMPSYEGTIEDNQFWSLVHYVRSLAGEKVSVQPSTGKILVKWIKGTLPETSLDSKWSNIPSTSIPLLLLWQRQEAIESITVRAIHNGKDIAFLLEWADFRPEARFLQSEEFVDACAIQFSLSKDPPHFSMGEKGGPVNIWHWRADRQYLVGALNLTPLQPRQRMRDAYPAMAVDLYLYRDDPLFLTGFGSGNLFSNPISVVEDLNSEGFGTLTSQEEKDQNVQGQGIWDNGMWKVVMIRSLKPKGSLDISFKSGGEVPVAFAVWDGSKGDRDGQKSVTPWFTLQLEK